MISIFQDRRWLKNPLDSGRLLLILLGLMGFLQLYVMWPGILTSDSQVQYAQAIAGAYSDHHPPLMSFVWRYLDKIIPGPGLMFGLHLSLLYAAIAFYMRSFRSFKARFLWLLLPLVPHVFIFSNLILKDVGFAFSFLLCAAYLSYCAAEHKKLLFYGMVALGVILLYGTALKFQAYYCAPIVLAWMAYARVQDGVHSKKFMLYFVGLVLVFYSCLHGINHMLVPDAQKNHAWQYVKIYDLAGISARTKASHFPTFSKLPNFSMESFLQQFDNRNHRVD